MLIYYIFGLGAKSALAKRLILGVLVHKTPFYE